jgi:hypothetical protein
VRILPEEYVLHVYQNKVWLQGVRSDASALSFAAGSRSVLDGLQAVIPAASQCLYWPRPNNSAPMFVRSQYAPAALAALEALYRSSRVPRQRLGHQQL